MKRIKRMKALGENARNECVDRMNHVENAFWVRVRKLDACSLCEMQQRVDSEWTKKSEFFDLEFGFYKRKQ